MEDGRGYSGIDSGKSIGLAEGIRLPPEAVESNRSRPKLGPEVCLVCSLLSHKFGEGDGLVKKLVYRLEQLEITAFSLKSQDKTRQYISGELHTVGC